jgi:hypothetical protein
MHKRNTGIGMALQKFIESVWNSSEKDLNELDEMRRVLESIQQSENKVYLVTVQSNNG